MRERVKEIILESIQVKEDLLKSEISRIVDIAQEITGALKKGGKLIVFGNGGSAGDAQHIAAELVGRFQKERPALPSIALTTNTSIITALANDFGYDTVFTRQLEALAKKGDIVLGISTSGKAKNVNLAIKEARKMGLKTIAFSGGDGGELAKLADKTIVVKSRITARIQEAHITIGHIICELIEGAFSS
jgi:D-sedoheptulose 7-phosphate isomerase